MVQIQRGLSACGKVQHSEARPRWEEAGLLIGERNPGCIGRPGGPVKVSLADTHWSADFLVPFGGWIDTHKPKAQGPGRRKGVPYETDHGAIARPIRSNVARRGHGKCPSAVGVHDVESASTMEQDVRLPWTPRREKAIRGSRG